MVNYPGRYRAKYSAPEPAAMRTDDDKIGFPSSCLIDDLAVRKSLEDLGHDPNILIREMTANLGFTFVNEIGSLFPNRIDGQMIIFNRRAVWLDRQRLVLVNRYDLDFSIAGNNVVARFLNGGLAKFRAVCSN